MADLKSFIHRFVAMQRGQEKPDPSLVLICADWLEERGDWRAELLRGFSEKWPPWPADSIVHHATNLLSVTCPACRGRPFKISVRVEPSGKVTTPTVEAWDLREGGGVGIHNGKLMRYESMPTPQHPFDSTHLGTVIADPIPCETCEGWGVVESWPAKPPAGPDTPAQPVPRPPAVPSTPAARSG